MDFSKYCRRFINYKSVDEGKFKRKVTNISAIGLLKSAKVQNNSAEKIMQYKVVIAENDEQSLILIDESNGDLLKEKKDLKFLTYSLCCVHKSDGNFIYLSDFANNCIRKFDENLNEIGKLNLPAGKIELNGPCGVSLGELNRLHVVDQKNLRVVIFDLENDKYLSEFKLFEEDFLSATRNAHPTNYDLSSIVPRQFLLDNIKAKER